jgi:hypothetical protein
VNDKTSEMGDSGGAPRRLRINPEPLKVVDGAKRDFWEKVTDEVQLDTAGKFRKRWTLADTIRVITADPTETYADVGAELDRSPGAVRFRRMAMVYLLRDDHDATDRVRAYRDNPKLHHRYHDYAQVYEALEGIGWLQLTVTEQFALALPLQQPTAGWRGDGTSAVLNSSSKATQLREEIQRLIAAARRGAGK